MGDEVILISNTLQNIGNCLSFLILVLPIILGNRSLMPFQSIDFFHSILDIEDDFI